MASHSFVVVTLLLCLASLLAASPPPNSLFFRGWERAKERKRSGVTSCSIIQCTDIGQPCAATNATDSLVVPLYVLLSSPFSPFSLHSPLSPSSYFSISSLLAPVLPSLYPLSLLPSSPSPPSSLPFVFLSFLLHAELLIYIVFSCMNNSSCAAYGTTQICIADPKKGTLDSSCSTDANCVSFFIFFLLLFLISPTLPLLSAPAPSSPLS